MIYSRSALIALIVLSLAAPLLAADSEPSARVTKKPASPSFADLNVERPMQLEQFVALLREKASDTQIVLAGGRQRLESLMVPPLHLKNVTMDQVTRLLQQVVPGLEVKVIEGEGLVPVYLLNWPANNAPSEIPRGQVMVFGLSDVVEHQAKRLAKNPAQIDPAARKAALDSVLSLIKAAVSQAGDDAPDPLVQVHEETETLIVKGVQPQITAVKFALDALKQRPQWVEEANSLNAEIRRMKDDLSNAKAEARDLREKLLQRDEEAAQLRAKLELLQRPGSSTKG